MSNTQLASPKDDLRRMQQIVEARQDLIAAVLPKHITVERQMRLLTTALARTPKLLQCEPLSVINALVTASEFGLEPNTPTQHCYIIPYKKQATFQLGYQGIIELALRSGLVTRIYARAVHQNDQFDLEYGFEERLVHKPFMGDRGQVIAYYAVFALRDGSKHMHFMTRQEVEDHRKYSQGWRFAESGPAQYGGGKKDSPWHTDFDSMALKTCVRLGSKWVPRSIEDRKMDVFLKAMALDVAHEQGIDPAAFGVALPLESSPDDGMAKLDALAERASAEDSAKPESKPKRTKPAPEPKPEPPREADDAPFEVDEDGVVNGEDTGEPEPPRNAHAGNGAQSGFPQF